MAVTIVQRLKPIEATHSNPTPQSRLYVFWVLTYFTCFVALVFFHQRGFATPTPASRLDCLESLTEYCTINISKWHTNTSNAIERDGLYYSDKAPGTLVFAVPGYYIGKKFASILITDYRVEQNLFWGSWGACVGIAIVSTTALRMLHLAFLSFIPSPKAWLAAFCLWFGGPQLPYATLLQSNGVTISLITISLSLLLNMPSVTKSKYCYWYALIGFLLGSALTCDYTCGIVIIGILAIFCRDWWCHATWVFIAFLLPCSLVLAYNHIASGDIFILPYQLQVNFPEMRVGFFGIRRPNIEVITNLLISPARGLVFWSPVYLLSTIGVFFNTGRIYPKVTLLYALFLINLLVISGRDWHWQAGDCLGPRLIYCSIPLLFLPVMTAWNRLPVISLLIGFISVFVNSTATATDVCLPQGITNPFIEFTLPMFLKRDISPNIMMHLPLSNASINAVFLGLIVTSGISGYALSKLSETGIRSELSVRQGFSVY